MSRTISKKEERSIRSCVKKIMRCRAYGQNAVVDKMAIAALAFKDAGYSAGLFIKSMSDTRSNNHCIHGLCIEHIVIGPVGEKSWAEIELNYLSSLMGMPNIVIRDEPYCLDPDDRWGNYTDSFHKEAAEAWRHRQVALIGAIALTQNTVSVDKTQARHRL